MIGEFLNNSEVRLIAELKYSQGFMLLLRILKQSINNDVMQLLELTSAEEEARLLAVIRAKHQIIQTLESNTTLFYEELATKEGLHPDGPQILSPLIGN